MARSRTVIAELGRARRFVDAWAIRRSTETPERNPKIAAILAIIGLNLMPTALGQQPLPGSLESSGPVFGQIATAFAMVGCFMCVAGVVMPRRWRDTGLAIEIGGCVFLAAGMFFYAAALMAFTPPEQRAYAYGASLGIAVGSVLRAGQIALYVRGRRLADKETHRELT